MGELAPQEYAFLSQTEVSAGRWGVGGTAPQDFELVGYTLQIFRGQHILAKSDLD